MEKIKVTSELGQLVTAYCRLSEQEKTIFRILIKPDRATLDAVQYELEIRKQKQAENL